MEQEKEIFKWGNSIATPEMYPVKLLPSIFVFEGNKKLGYKYLQAVNFTRGTWGEPDASVQANSRLPHILDVTWLSWVEAKVYTGSFELPTEKINKLFREGYKDYLSHQTNYKELIVGLAPEGVVFLWVWGNMSCVEVARFQAVEKKDATIKEVSSTTNRKNIREYCDAVMKSDTDIIEYVSKHGLNNHIWDTYRQRFKIRPVVEYPFKGKGITDHFEIKFLNGEMECLNYVFLQENPYKDRARMEKMDVYYANEQEMFLIELRFDEEEIMKAYQKIYGNNPQQEVDFVVTVHPVNRVLRLAFRKTVEGRREEVALEKTEIKMIQFEDSYRKHFKIFNLND